MHNILLSSSSPHLTRGGQKSIYLLLKHLDRARFNPVFVCSQEGSFSEEVKELNIETVCCELPSLRTFNLIRFFSTFKKLVDLVKNKGIHLIHVESSRGVFWFGLVSKWTGVPLIWHARIAIREKPLYERFLYALTHRIIAVSGAVKQRFKDYPNYVEKVCIVYNAVDEDNFVLEEKIREEMRAQLKVNDKFLIGLIGQVMPLKGQENFIQAAARVVQNEKNVHFVVIGSGELDDLSVMAQLISKLSLDLHVSVIDYQKNMDRVYSALDLLVNASTTEGFSRVILEAMAVGLPVIATRAGGNSEAVDHNMTGFLVDINNSEQMAEAMLKMVTEPQRAKEMGRCGREKVKNLFNIRQYIGGIREVYEHLL